MRKSFLFATAAVTALCTSGALAADPALNTVVVADYRAQPELITVSATRTEQMIDVTGASVTVLLSGDLKTQQTVALTDILKQVPTLVVTRNGGLGQPASVSLRGAEAGQTVVLIDGVRVNDSSTTDDSAAAALGDLLVNGIDRVEILRGPQSTLYGSDAMGGVINIISKRGGDTPFALNATAEGGSFDTFHANVATHGEEGIVEYGGGLNFLTTTGVSTADSRNGNHENDGYTNYGGTANARVHITDTVSVDLRGYYTHGHDDFDDGFGGPPAFLVADSAANNTNELKVGYAGSTPISSAACFTTALRSWRRKVRGISSTRRPTSCTRTSCFSAAPPASNTRASSMLIPGRQRKSRSAQRRSSAPSATTISASSHSSRRRPSAATTG